jgi:hypothetical protein
VEVRVEGWPTRPARAGFMVAPPLVEFSEAGLKEASLGEMARIARGRYFRLDEAGGLAEAAGRAVQAVKDADAVTEDRELWDMPFLLILLLGLAGAEWMIRRRCGLA